MDIVFKVLSPSHKNCTYDVHVMHIDRFYIGSIRHDKNVNNANFRCEMDYFYNIKILKSILSYMRSLVRTHSFINYVLDFSYCEKIDSYRVYKYWEKIQIGTVHGSKFYQGIDTIKNGRHYVFYCGSQQLGRIYLAAGNKAVFIANNLMYINTGILVQIVKVMESISVNHSWKKVGF